MEESQDINQHFLNLVLMLASACWQQLGKTPNPVTGETEKLLEHACVTLDILKMFREKTKNNLTPEENRLLNKTIADLEMNYADEVERDNQSPKN